MNWIKIEDKLPEHNQRVLVIDEAKGSPYIRIMIFEGFEVAENTSIWVQFLDGHEVGNPDEVHTTDSLEIYYSSRSITHWMPLPDLKLGYTTLGKSGFTGFTGHTMAGLNPTSQASGMCPETHNGTYSEHNKEMKPFGKGWMGKRK